MKINLTGDKRSFLGFLSNLKINKITSKSKTRHRNAMASGLRRLGKDTRRNTHTQIEAFRCFHTHAHFYTDKTCEHMKSHGLIHTQTDLYGHTQIRTDSHIMKRHSFLGMSIC